MLSRRSGNRVKAILIGGLFAGLIAAPAAVMAGPRFDTALAHFKKGCMAKPLAVNNSFDYFYGLDGYKPWGPNKRRKPGTNQFGMKTDRMTGIFVFRSTDKSITLLASAGFGNVASCSSEFTPDLSWEKFVKSSQAYIAKQPGFTRQVVKKRKGKSLQYEVDAGVMTVMKLNNGDFRIMIANKPAKKS